MKIWEAHFLELNLKKRILTGYYHLYIQYNRVLPNILEFIRIYARIFGIGCILKDIVEIRAYLHGVGKNIFEKFDVFFRIQKE